MILSLGFKFLKIIYTFDSSWHSGMAGGMGGMGDMGGMVSGPGTVLHRPDYFMINGRDGDDTLTDPATAIEAGPRQKVLIRLNNVGYQPARVKLGGVKFDVIASDGRPLAQTLHTYSQLIAPGERYDLLVTIPWSGIRTATVDYYHIRGDGGPCWVLPLPRLPPFNDHLNGTNIAGFVKVVDAMLDQGLV